MSGINRTFWVDLSRICALNLHDLLTVTQSVPFFPDTLYTRSNFILIFYSIYNKNNNNNKHSASAQAQSQQKLLSDIQPPTQPMLPSLQHISNSQHKRRRRLRDFTLQILITWLVMVIVSNNKILVTISNDVNEQHKAVFGNHYLSADQRYDITSIQLFHHICLSL